jgi:hypothetical protein
MVARSENEAMVVCGGVCVWRESGVRVCVGAFGRSLASVAVKIFSHLIYFVKKFYKFCTFSATLKVSAAMNYITVQHKKGLFPSPLTGHV